MLPTHGGTYYGGKSRRHGGQTTSQVLLIALLLSSLLLGIGFWRTNLRNSHLIKELKQLRSNHEEADSNHKSYYNKMEHESVLSQRRIQELSRELNYAEAKVRELTTQKDSCTVHESQLNLELQETKEQLNYEKAIVDAHKIKITQLEKAHAAREADWHELSKAWAQFEADATKENTRLLQELNALQSKTGSPASVSQHPSIQHHTLPNEEPKNRPETNLDFHIDLPKEEDFVHHHAPHTQGAAAGPTHGSPSQAGSTPGPHDTHVDAQGHAAPEHHGHGDHHSNIYNHHYHDWHDGPEFDHVDPLDHYWTGHDHFNEGHDNFHDGHYHHYGDHAADHQQHGDTRHLQEHGNQHQAHPNERIHSYHDDWGHYSDHHFDNHFDHWDGHHWEGDHAHHEQHHEQPHQDIHSAPGHHDTHEQQKMHDSQEQQRHAGYRYQGRVH